MPTHSLCYSCRWPRGAGAGLHGPGGRAAEKAPAAGRDFPSEGSAPERSLPAAGTYPVAANRLVEGEEPREEGDSDRSSGFWRIGK